MRGDRTLRGFMLWIIGMSVVTFGWLAAIRVTGHQNDVFSSFSDVLDPEYAAQSYAVLPIIGYLVWGRVIAGRFGGWSSHAGRAIHCLGLGALMWGVGNLVWMYYDTCWKLPGAISCGKSALDPYPSLADAFYLSLLPLFGYALLSISRMMTLSIRQWSWCAVYMLGALVVTGYVGLPTVNLGPLEYGKGYFISSGISTLTFVVGITYVLVDVVLIAMALVIATNSRRLAGGAYRAPIIAMVVTIVALYTADFFFQYRSSAGLSVTADPSEFTFALFQALAMVTIWLFGHVDWQFQQMFAEAEASFAAELDADAAADSMMDEDDITSPMHPTPGI